MQNIIDFSNCPYSIKHGSYGGKAGDKDGILYNNSMYIIKYPKPSRYYQNINDMSYVTSPLSEYIGSHIYNILGYDVHETVLGYRNNKIVVACKDFCQTPGMTLMEMRTIKNGANRELENILEVHMHSSTTDDRVDLKEQMLHLQYNPTLKKVNGVNERFWDTVVIDILIDNNDRNNGNWGVIVDMNSQTYRLAPIYDNGNAFSNKATNKQLEQYMKADDISDRLTGGRTAYEINGKQISAKKMLKQNIPELQQAIYCVVPNIRKHLDEIEAFIQEIPETYQNTPVCSPIRKDYYITGVKTRLHQMLEPEYERICHMRHTPEECFAELDTEFGDIIKQKADIEIEKQ